jgi:hypothetical protein
MAIRFKKYVDIVSRVGGADVVPARQFGGRFYDQNVRIPTGSVIEFSDANSVSKYFGAATPEHNYSLFYFSFIGKQVTKPKIISFARWNPANTAPIIIGGSKIGSIAEFVALTVSNKFALSIGGTRLIVTGMDFSAVVTYADIAAVLQAAIRAVGASSGANWTACTVTCDGTRFTFTGGETNATDVPVEIFADTPSGDATTIDLIRWRGLTGFGALLAYTEVCAINSAGAKGQEPDVAFAKDVENDNNFGSFFFIDDLTVDQVIAIATENNSYNNNFIFCFGVTSENVDSLVDIIDLSGTATTAIENPISASDVTPNAALIPMVILAATDFNRPDASQNYMFQQADIDPIVFDTALSDILDSSRINYYGATQTAGKLISFYQRGYMTGGADDATDIGTYANEIWFKEYISVALMNILLALGKVSANAQGRGVILSTIQSRVNLALYNGVISVGKILTNTQKAYITSITGSPDSWRQVQDTGYWLDVFIERDTITGDYKARYLLVYSKDDAIRKVEGSDVLI